MHEGAGEDVPALIEALAGEIAEVWEPPKQRVRLTAEKPKLEF
jgi:hypothetical protein